MSQMGSIMTDGRRQTGRQTFVLRVIGSSTARIRERLADGDVIVVEVIRGLVLDRGFLDVWFRSLRDVVVVGLITCERVALGEGAKVLICWSAQGIFVHHILEDEVDGQEEGQDDKREDGEEREESVVVEESQNTTHEDDT